MDYLKEFFIMASKKIFIIALLLITCFIPHNAQAIGKCILSDSIILVSVFGKAMGTIINVNKKGNVNVCIRVFPTMKFESKWEKNVYEYNEYYPYSKKFTLSCNEIYELQDCLDNRDTYNLYTSHTITRYGYEFYLYINGKLHTHQLETPGFPNGTPPELEHIYPTLPYFQKIIDILTAKIGDYHFYKQYVE